MTPRLIKQDRSRSEVDFRTPPELFKALDAEFGPFNLDVAASDENALCSGYFSIEGDALNRSWRIYPWHRPGTRVWCNPPYNHISPWVKKGIGELELGCESVTYLLPASTCTKWFKELWESEFCSHIIFVSGRLAFQGPHVHPDLKKASAPNPTVVIHLNKFNEGPPTIERRDRDAIR